MNTTIIILLSPLLILLIGGIIVKMRKEEYTFMTIHSTKGDLNIIDTKNHLVVDGGKFTTPKDFTITSDLTITGNLQANYASVFASYAIETTGTLKGTGLTVTSLSAGNGTIETSGQLQGEESTVTSLSAGSGGIQTIGTLQGNNVNIGGTTLNWQDVGNFVYYKDFPQSDGTTSSGIKYKTYVISLPRPPGSTKFRILLFKKDVQRTKVSDYDDLTCELWLYGVSPGNTKIYSKKGNATEIEDDHGTFDTFFNLGTSNFVQVEARIITSTNDNARLADHGIVYKWVY